MAKVSIPLFYDVSIRNWVSEAGATSIISKIALGQLNEVDIVLAIVQDGAVIELTSPTWILGIKELNSQSGDYLIQETTATKTGTGTATRYTFNFSFDSTELRTFLATLDPNEDYCALEIRDTTNGIVTAPALTISPYAAYTIDGTTPTSALGILVVASGKTATINNTITITGTDATTYDLDDFGGGDAVLYTSQTLTSPQKEQARTNIGLPTNTVGLQGADALTLAGTNPQTPTLSVTGAEFTESEVSTSGVIFSQAFSNVDEACHGISIAATSGVTPNGDSSIMRILSQDVEQFGFNFNGSPRINSNRQSAWRTQLGVAAKDGEAINPSTIGATTSATSISCDIVDIYGTRTSGTIYERLRAKWNSTNSTFTIEAEKGSGGGTARNIDFVVDGNRTQITRFGARFYNFNTGVYAGDLYTDGYMTLSATADASAVRLYHDGAIYDFDKTKASFNMPLELPRVKTTATVVSSLVAAATAGAGARSFVTDSNAAASGNFGAVVAGGGSNAVPVYSDGTNWRIG